MKPLKQIKNSSRRSLLQVVVVASVVFAIGAITVLSRARPDADQRPLPQKRETHAQATTPQRSLVAAQGDEPRELSLDEAQKLGAGLKDLVNQSTEGLVEVTHADGSVSLDQQGRFQSVTVARINKDGSITQSCVDNPRSAAAFFGIDPKLIDKTDERGGYTTAKIAPAKSSN